MIVLFSHDDTGLVIVLGINDLESHFLNDQIYFVFDL